MSRSRLRSTTHSKQVKGVRSHSSDHSGNIISALLSAVSWVILGLVVAFFAFIFLVEYSGNQSFRTFVVQSGSMEPSIMTGDIIIIVPQLAYTISDVITFKGSEDRVITHRIIKEESTAEEILFVTKGDANRETDTEVVPLERIVGKVILVVPKLGYFVTFGKSLYGIIALIVIPAAIIVADELGNLLLTKQSKK